MTDPDAQVLRVAPNAPLSEVKKAFRRAALESHPDQNPDPAAAHRFRVVSEAYRNLAARALVREGPPPVRERPAAERISFLLAEIQLFLRRWEPDRWSQVVDGLPASVWVAGVLEVLGNHLEGPGHTVSVAPSREALSAVVEALSAKVLSSPETKRSPKQNKALREALQSAETRLRALGRPRRKGVNA